MKQMEFIAAGPPQLYSEHVRDRFHAKVDRKGADECWLWKGAADTCSIGYGRFTLNGKKLYAHRVAFEIEHGQIIDGQVIRHSCDTPNCCNPGHLVNGHQADNMADMRDRGRSRPRLTRKQVVEIDAKAIENRAHWTDARLASLYRVSETSIRRLLSGATWGNVTGRKTRKTRKTQKSATKTENVGATA